MMITLVRHAQVEEGYHNRYNGHIDIGLSQRGYDQAYTLARHFEENRFDAVYCSDLIRARETLKPIHIKVEPYFTDQIREKSWGRHEAKTFDEIMMMEGQRYESFDQWMALLDGEDFTTYTVRIKHFFTVYLPAQGYKNVLVITHAGAIRTLISVVKGIPIEAAFGVHIGYADYITLDTDGWHFGEVICPR